MTFRQPDFASLEKQTFVETFKYKLIYVYTIGDRKHEGYLRTRFARFLVSLRKATQHATRDVYAFVPLQDFTSKSDIDWSRPVPEIDAQLYAKYGITKSEQKFIESMIKPME